PGEPHPISDPPPSHLAPPDPGTGSKTSDPGTPHPINDPPPSHLAPPDPSTGSPNADPAPPASAPVGPPISRPPNPAALILRLLALFPALFGFAVLFNERGSLSPVLFLLGVLPFMLGLWMAWKGPRAGCLGRGVSAATVWFGFCALAYLVVESGQPPPPTSLRPASFVVEGRRVQGGGTLPFRFTVQVQDGPRLSWVAANLGEKGSIATSGQPEPVTWLPMDWKPGEQSTRTSTVWLTRRAFQQLKAGGRPEWYASPRGAPILWWIAPFTQGRSTLGRLDLVKATWFRLRVNGRTRSVRVLKARDWKSNSYWFLDDEHNPLIVKMVPNRFTLGLVAVDGIFLWTPVNYLAWNDWYRITELTTRP
ncbi:MAG: hypothetical protein AB1758_29365, partial [Candidatus Eremiobacterota bacterium]